MLSEKIVARGEWNSVSGQIDGVDLLAVRFVDLQVKQFISTCSTSTVGPPRETKHNGFINHPQMAYDYLNNAAGIDIHNHVRTGSFGLEDVWMTIDPSVRQPYPIMGYKYQFLQESTNVTLSWGTNINFSKKVPTLPYHGVQISISPRKYQRYPVMGYKYQFLQESTNLTLSWGTNINFSKKVPTIPYHGVQISIFKYLKSSMKQSIFNMIGKMPLMRHKCLKEAFSYPIIKYYLLCCAKWVGQREKITEHDYDKCLLKQYAEVELLSEIESQIRNGVVLSIADTEVTYQNILEEYGIYEDLSVYYQRRYLKDLILGSISHAKCVAQKDPSKPHLIQSFDIRYRPPYCSNG